MNDLQIDYFLAVADSGSFTRAAQKFYISQPAISRVISALERELGFPLFDRTNRRTTLTSAGKLFYEAFCQSKQLIAAAVQAAQSINSDESGTIQLGLLSGLDFSSLILNLDERFARTYPNITMNTVFSDFQELRNSLENGRADAILTIEDSLPRMPQAQTRILAESFRLLLYAKRHPLAGNDGLTPWDFRAERFLVVMDENPHAGDLVTQYCAPYGFSPRLLTVPNIDSLVAGVQNLQGVAIVDGWSRERTNAAFGYLPLNSANRIVLAWLPTCSNPLFPLFLNELTLLSQYCRPD